MMFTDLFFLFGFLPLAMVLYWPVRNKPANNGVLLVLSLLFYGWGSWKNLAVLCLLLLWFYAGALVMCSTRTAKGKTIQFVITITGSLLVLGVYKYLQPALSLLEQSGMHLPVQPLAMPVGLSFYLFSLLSYLIDVYTGKAPVQTSLVKLGVFAAFFGRVNMGPIAHYAQTLPQLDHHPYQPQIFMKGGPLFFQGLFMKVLLADNLALLFAGLAGNTSWLGNLLYGFSYFLLLYLDFSGYSRMARGLGCFFGFSIPKNFNKPYTAPSVQAFWRCWHISLTRWFTQYVYIPLGGSRVSTARWIGNVLIVWLLTGIWHGSRWTFLVWGLFQAALLIGEKLLWGRTLEHSPALVRHGYVVLCQLIGWTFFFSPSLSAALMVIGRYAGIGISGWADRAAWFYLANYGLVLLCSMLLCTRLPKQTSWKVSESIPAAWRYVRVLGYACLLVLALSALIAATNQTFLYTAF